MSTTTKKKSNRPSFKLRKKLATWDSTGQWGCSHQSWWAELILRQMWRRRSTLRLLRWKHCWKITSHLGTLQSSLFLWETTWQLLSSCQGSSRRTCAKDCCTCRGWMVDIVTTGVRVRDTPSKAWRGRRASIWLKSWVCSQNTEDRQEDFTLNRSRMDTRTREDWGHLFTTLTRSQMGNQACRHKEIASQALVKFSGLDE